MCVFFTLNHSFYPSTSSTPSVCPYTCIIGLIVPANRNLVPSGLGLRPDKRVMFGFVSFFFFLFFSFRFFSFLFLPFSHSFFSFFFLYFSSGDDVPVYTVDMCHGIILLQVIGDSTLLYCYRCCCGPAECAVLLLLLLLLSFRVRSV